MFDFDYRLMFPSDGRHLNVRTYCAGMQRYNEVVKCELCVVHAHIYVSEIRTILTHIDIEFDKVAVTPYTLIRKYSSEHVALDCAYGE